MLNVINLKTAKVGNLLSSIRQSLTQSSNSALTPYSTTSIQNYVWHIPDTHSSSLCLNIQIILRSLLYNVASPFSIDLMGSYGDPMRSDMSAGNHSAGYLNVTYYYHFVVGPLLRLEIYFLKRTLSWLLGPIFAL